MSSVVVKITSDLGDVEISRSASEPRVAEFAMKVPPSSDPEQVRANIDRLLSGVVRQARLAYEISEDGS